MYLSENHKTPQKQKKHNINPYIIPYNYFQTILLIHNKCKLISKHVKQDLQLVLNVMQCLSTIKPYFKSLIQKKQKTIQLNILFIDLNSNFFHLMKVRRKKLNIILHIWLLNEILRKKKNVLNFFVFLTYIVLKRKRIFQVHKNLLIFPQT